MITCGNIPDPTRQRLHPQRITIQTGDHCIGCTAGVHKAVLSADSDLFQRFQAVAHKCRTEDQQFFYPLLWHLFQPDVRERLQPALAQSRLKGIAVLPRRYTQETDYFPGGGKTLMPVAGSVCR